ncbi:MAG: hypothetical protein FJ247_10505 [Nitrospira sp.]|nr:hypothetical protein [Nitrospira sp.]
MIHRIPSAEQLDAARPAKPTFARMLSQKGAAFFRSAIDAFSSSLETARRSESQANQAASGDQVDEQGTHRGSESECRPDEGWMGGVEPDVQHRAARAQSAEAAMSPPQSLSGVSHEEEICELRTFLLRQQQDIVRLTAQLQELKAMVQSQQQVLLCFEKESELTSASYREERVASAVAKGNTMIRIRQKPVAKDKAMAEKGNSTRASLNL